MKTRSLLTTAAVIVGGVAPVTVAATPAVAAAESCNGLPATIVGSPGTGVDGTSGDDVIVSNGASEVRAYGGDDTICTTETAASTGHGEVTVTVLAGTGDDLIDRRGDTNPAAVGHAFGDAGEDTILGAPGRDLFNGNDGERDVVSTGAGNDSGDNGAPGGGETAADPDEIDLGAGDDSFGANPSSPPLHVNGGSGLDRLDFRVHVRTSWTIDARAGSLRGASGVAMTFDGFEDYSGSSLNLTARISFVGTDGPERFVGPAREVRSFDMGGGNDVLSLISYSGGAHRSKPRLEGGPGRDEIQVWAPLRDSVVLLNLDAARLSIKDGLQGKVRSFEDANARGGHVTLTGSRGRNDLTWFGCQGGSVRAGAGDDRVSVLSKDRERRCRREVRLHAFGQGGDDLLTGGRNADLLVGGSGLDRARGGMGSDRCVAEVKRSCEA